MKKEINLRTWLVPRLRRLSYQWPPRNQAKALARVSRGQYKCAICNNIFGPKEVQLDHINPIIDVKEGFQDFGIYVTSLFCKVDSYQVLCVKCHSEKTDRENEERKKNKALDSK